MCVNANVRAVRRGGAQKPPKPPPQREEEQEDKKTTTYVASTKPSSPPASPSTGQTKRSAVAEANTSPPVVATAMAHPLAQWPPRSDKAGSSVPGTGWGTRMPFTPQRGIRTRRAREERTSSLSTPSFCVCV